MPYCKATVFQQQLAVGGTITIERYAMDLLFGQFNFSEGFQCPNFARQARLAIGPACFVTALSIRCKAMDSPFYMRTMKYKVVSKHKYQGDICHHSVSSEF